MNPFTIFLSPPQSGPLLCIGLCFGAEVERWESPRLDRPTAEMSLLGSALRGSSLLTSFSEATFLSKGFSLWFVMGLAP